MRKAMHADPENYVTSMAPGQYWTWGTHMRGMKGKRGQTQWTATRLNQNDTHLGLCKDTRHILFSFVVPIIWVVAVVLPHLHHQQDYIQHHYGSVSVAELFFCSVSLFIVLVAKH